MKLNEANPQIVVTGIGTMPLSHAVKRVQDMLANLQQRASGPTTSENWNTIQTLIDRDLLQTYIGSIAKALNEIH